MPRIEPTTFTEKLCDLYPDGPTEFSKLLGKIESKRMHEYYKYSTDPIFMLNPIA